MEVEIDALFHNVVQIPKICEHFLEDLNFVGENFKVDIINIKNFIEQDLTDEQKSYFIKRFMKIDKIRADHILLTLENLTFSNNYDFLELLAISSKIIFEHEGGYREKSENESIIDNIMMFSHILHNGYYLLDSRVTLETCQELDRLNILEYIFCKDDVSYLLHSLQEIEKDEFLEDSWCGYATNKNVVVFLISRLEDLFKNKLDQTYNDVLMNMFL